MLDDLLSFDSFLELYDQLVLSFLGNQWIGQDSLDLVSDGRSNYIDSETLKVLALFSLVI